MIPLWFVIVFFIVAAIVGMAFAMNSAQPYPEEKPMPEKRLLLTLSDRETRDYCATRDRLIDAEKNVENARAEIFGWLYQVALQLKKNPTEIHIERNGKVWESLN